MTIAPRRIVRSIVAGSACLLLAAPTGVEASLPSLSRDSAERVSMEASLLVAQFERALRSNDPGDFADAVACSFRETTLARFVRQGDVPTRRASIYALGLVGSYKVNAAVASALKDADPVNRAMADRALKAIWYRADSLENNERLRKIMVSIDRGLHDLAIEQADQLVKLAPDFAEAYNQRAIAYFFSGRPARSAEDCRKTIDRNPYHLGALSGLAQCLLRLDRRDEAIKVLRRASAIEPYNLDLKRTIRDLEAL